VDNLIKYMVMSRDQNAGQNSNVQSGNKSLETVEQFKYLGTTLTNQNSIHEEIKGRLKSGNASYHSVQNILSSSLLSKSVKMKVYRTIIFLVFCTVVKLVRSYWRSFENRVLRRIFEPKRNEVTGEWRRLHNKELYALYSSPNVIRVV
jgi:hypothetical protein